jgi:hypothetical protein
MFVDAPKHGLPDAKAFTRKGDSYKFKGNHLKVVVWISDAGSQRLVEKKT